jgi:hypothetical protein
MQYVALCHPWKCRTSLPAIGANGSFGLVNIRQTHEQSLFSISTCRTNSQSLKATIFGSVAPAFAQTIP